MRRVLLASAAAVLGVALAAAPAEAARTVQVMVVGKTAVLAGPQKVKLTARTVQVRGKRCATGSRTALLPATSTSTFTRAPATPAGTRANASASPMSPARLT